MSCQRVRNNTQSFIQGMKLSLGPLVSSHCTAAFSQVCGEFRFSLWLSFIIASFPFDLFFFWIIQLLMFLFYFTGNMLFILKVLYDGWCYFARYVALTLSFLSIQGMLGKKKCLFYLSVQQWRFINAAKKSAVEF